MKVFAWAALALMAACLGCAQGGSQTSGGSTSSRLEKLETSFESFQQDQLLAQKLRQTRDAEIDAKLNQIVTRLDSLAPGAKTGKPARPAKLVRYSPAGCAVPLVAGQVIPMTAFAPASAPSGAPASTPPASSSQPASPQTKPLTPAASKGVAPKSVGPSAQAPGKIQPGQVRSLQAAQPQQPRPATNSLGLQPPVVTLSPQQQVPQPYASRPAAAHTRKPMPYEAAVRSGAGRSRPRVAGPKPSQEVSSAAESAAPAATATPSTPVASAGQNDPVEAAQLYADGMRAIAGNKNDEGRRKMNELLSKYPNTDKAPLALYWVGESYMNERSYNQAILAFKDLTTRYPKSFKAPESVYKVAEAYERLGDKSNAIFHLKLLVSEYPGSELAGKAKRKLKELGQ